MITKAEFKNNIWQIGQTVPSYKLSVGDKIWCPVSTSNHLLLEVEYHNVTELRSQCCWALTVGTTCTYKYCYASDGSKCCC